MKRVLVCGSRNFNDYELMDGELTKLWQPHETILIHGDQRGADRMSEDWLKRQYPVDPDHIKRFPYRREYGKAGGPIRNQQMLDEGKPDLVVAFPHKDSVGTWDMVKRAQSAGVETVVVLPRD